MGDKRKSEDLTNSRLESLGWRSQSGVQPKKRKEIEGVGATSLVALQAQLAKTQQQAALIKQGKLDPEELKERRKGRIGGLVDKKNKGVDERNKKDCQQIPKKDKLTESREALERKARIYDQLASGNAVDEDEKYEVDFLMKDIPFQPRRSREAFINQQQQQQHVVDTTGLAVQSQTGGLISGDMEMERKRREWEGEVGNAIAEEQALEAAREERLDLVEQIEHETKMGRDRAEYMRQQRLQAEAQKRERLKAEFLRKKLEMVKKTKEQK